MNQDLTKARALLKNIHARDEHSFSPEIVTAPPDYTVMVSTNDFYESFPLVEIISNEELLKLYDYAVRCFNGDPAFDDFDGTLIGIGDDDLESIFVDLFNALTDIDSNNVCRVMDYEFYAIGCLIGNS